MSDPVTVVVHFRAKEGRSADLRRVISAAVPNLSGLRGCRGGTLHHDIDDDDLFVLVERWDTAADHKAYLQAIEDDGTMDALRPLLAGEPQRRYLAQA
jgi:quinol monooxygenase YgiN